MKIASFRWRARTSTTSSTTGPQVRDVHSSGDAIVNTIGLRARSAASNETVCMGQTGLRVHMLVTPSRCPGVGVATETARCPIPGVVGASRIVIGAMP